MSRNVNKDVNRDSSKVDQSVKMSELKFVTRLHFVPLSSETENTETEAA